MSQSAAINQKAAAVMASLDATEAACSVLAISPEAAAHFASVEREQVAEGYEHYKGKSDMRVTVFTRDYRGYAVASDALADALRGFVAEVSL